MNYNYKKSIRPARPRSRVLQGTSNVSISAASYISSSSGGVVEGHTHVNYLTLAQIGRDGYYLIWGDEEPEKVWAGYADKAAIAEQAAKADEADHAKEADYAKEANHAATADNSERWNEEHFEDWLDQPVRTTDDVKFSRVDSGRVVSPHFTTPDFVPDIVGGYGFAAIQDPETGHTTAYTDDLVVRGRMSVTEIEIQNVNAVGGILVVSKGSGKTKGVMPFDGEMLVILDLEDGEENQFVAGDLVRWGRLDRQTGEYRSGWCEVLAIYTGSFGTGLLLDVNTHLEFRSEDGADVLVSEDGVTLLVSEADASGLPAEGDNLVLMGSKIEGRQGFIIISAEDGIENISVYSGVDTPWALKGKLRTRLGGLKDVEDADFGALDGYGLWGDNVYLRGKFMLRNAAGSDVEIGEQIQLEVGNGIAREFAKDHENLVIDSIPMAFAGVSDGYVTSPMSRQVFFYLTEIPQPGEMVTLRLVGMFGTRSDIFLGSWQDATTFTLRSQSKEDTVHDVTFEWPEGGTSNWLAVRLQNYGQPNPGSGLFLRSLILVRGSYIPSELRAEDYIGVGLLKTGINIEQGKITATANNFEVRNNAGETTMALDGEGKLNVNLIRTEAIQSRVVTCFGSEAGRPLKATLNANGDGEYIIYHKPELVDNGLGGIFMESRPHVVFNWDEQTESVAQCYDLDGNLLWTLGNKGFENRRGVDSYRTLKLSKSDLVSASQFQTLPTSNYYQYLNAEDVFNGLVFVTPDVNGEKIPDGVYYEANPIMKVATIDGDSYTGSTTQYIRRYYNFTGGRIVGQGSLDVAV